MLRMNLKSTATRVDAGCPKPEVFNCNSRSHISVVGMGLFVLRTPMLTVVIAIIIAIVTRYKFTS